MNIIERGLFFLSFAFVGLCSVQAAAKPQATTPKEPILLVVAPERQLLLRRTTADVISLSKFEREHVRRFFMLATGPESADVRYNFGSSFFGELGDNQLRITNAPYSNLQTYEDRAAVYKKQSETLWQCVRYVVKDLGPRGIRLPKDQKGCRFSQPDSETVVASSGLCFFEIDLGSTFTVSYELNPNCLQRDFLEQHKISPTDFFVFSGYYIAEDASGSSMNIDPIAQSRLHLSVEPWNKTIPLSADFGPDFPRWSASFGYDVHAGPIKLFNNSDGQQLLEVPLLTNNRCPDTCVNNACASICNFSVALGTQSQIARITPSGKLQTLDSWFTGATIPAQWEGFLPAQRTFPTPLLKAGERYRISMDLSYPDAYFRLFRDGFKEFALQVDAYAAGSDITGTFQPLPTLSPLRSLDGKLANFPTLTELPRWGSFVRSLSPLEAMKRLLTLGDWPPYYEKACLAGKCGAASTKETALTLQVDFTVFDSQDGQPATLGNFVVRRYSKLGTSYETSVEKLPDVEFVPASPF